MKPKTILALAFVFLATLGTGFIVFKYYSYLFARNVTGEILGIERVTQPTTIVGGSVPIPNSQIFSFAIAVKDAKSGEIVTASSEDRQWAVALKGQCAEAKFLAYPPWQLDKAGTYFGARLMRLFECEKKESPSSGAKPEATSPSSSPTTSTESEPNTPTPAPNDISSAPLIGQ